MAEELRPFQRWPDILVLAKSSCAHQATTLARLCVALVVFKKICLAPEHNKQVWQRRHNLPLQIFWPGRSCSFFLAAWAAKPFAQGDVVIQETLPWMQRSGLKDIAAKQDSSASTTIFEVSAQRPNTGRREMHLAAPLLPTRTTTHWKSSCLPGKQSARHLLSCTAKLSFNPTSCRCCGSRRRRTCSPSAGSLRWLWQDAAGQPRTPSSQTSVRRMLQIRCLARKPS